MSELVFNRDPGTGHYLLIVGAVARGSREPCCAVGDCQSWPGTKRYRARAASTQDYRKCALFTSSALSRHPAAKAFIRSCTLCSSERRHRLFRRSRCAMMAWFRLGRIRSRKLYRRESTLFCSRGSRPTGKRAGNSARKPSQDASCAVGAPVKTTSVAASRSACLTSRSLNEVLVVTGWPLPTS